MNHLEDVSHFLYSDNCCFPSGPVYTVAMEAVMEAVPELPNRDNPSPCVTQLPPLLNAQFTYIGGQCGVYNKSSYLNIIQQILVNPFHHRRGSGLSSEQQTHVPDIDLPFLAAPFLCQHHHLWTFKMPNLLFSYST